MTEKQIYLDYASCTPLDPKVSDLMCDISKRRSQLEITNPLSIHSSGLRSNMIVENARRSVAKSLSVKESEILFVSSATFSDNLAIKGYIDHLHKKGRAYKDMHVITTKVDHVAVINTCKNLEDLGVEVSYVCPDEMGMIHPEYIERLLKKETVLVSVVMVSSEVGTVQSIRNISKVIKGYNNDIVFHTDAAQAAVYYKCIPNSLGVDMLTIDGAKIYGPMGVGILYKSSKVSIEPIVRGGKQEFGLNAGTTNIEGVSGFARALELSDERRDGEVKRVSNIRNEFVESVKENIKGSFLHGGGDNYSTKNLAPHYAYIYIPDVDSEYVASQLDMKNILVGTKVACNEDSISLKEMYKNSSNKLSQGIRFTFGILSTLDDIPVVINALKDIIKNYKVPSKKEKMESV